MNHCSHLPITTTIRPTPIGTTPLGVFMFLPSVIASTHNASKPVENTYNMNLSVVLLGIENTVN